MTIVARSSRVDFSDICLVELAKGPPRARGWRQKGVCLFKGACLCSCLQARVSILRHALAGLDLVPRKIHSRCMQYSHRPGFSCGGDQTPVVTSATSFGVKEAVRYLGSPRNDSAVTGARAFEASRSDCGRGDGRNCVVGQCYVLDKPGPDDTAQRRKSEGGLSATSGAGVQLLGGHTRDGSWLSALPPVSHAKGSFVGPQLFISTPGTFEEPALLQPATVSVHPS